MNIFNKRLLDSKLHNFKLPDNYDKEKAIKHIRDLQHFLKNEASRTKETAIQGLFLQRIFEDILKYDSQLSGKKEHFLKIEPKTEADNTRPDGSLGIYGETSKTFAVIELKDANTTLDSKQYGRSSQLTPVE